MPIVPSLRLIYLVALLLPLALLGVLQPAWVIWVWLAALLLLLVAVVDLLRSAKLLESLRIDAEPVSRLARDTEGSVTLHLRSDDPPVGRFLVGLPLETQFLVDVDVLPVRLSGDANHWQVVWRVTGRTRGVFAMPDAFVEIGSKWGLFGVRKRYALEGEIRVYPNLRRERRQLANLFLNRGVIGVHAQRMVGQGREYEQLREYSVGDSMLDVHWKASAKRGELVTKTYQVERTQEIYLIVDHSRLSGLRSMRADSSVDSEYVESVLERYVTAASVLGMVAEREGDLFGMVAFGQRVSRFVRASSGKQHGQVIQDALFDLKTERGPFDLDELFTFLRLRLRRRALLVFLTDLSDTAAAEEFEQRVDLVASQHVVLVNTLRREGVYPMYGRPEEAAAGAIAEEMAGHLRWAGLRELQVNLRARGVEFSLLDDENLSVDLVNQYLAVKQRQVL